MSIVDRATPPPSGPIRHFDFPEVTRGSLVDGLDLRVARVSRLPVVAVNLFVRAGEQDLPAERAGLAYLTGEALEGGTRRRSGGDLAEALESIGARIDVAAGWEGTSASLTCLADRLPEALPLLVETLLEPSFPDDEVERTREQRLAAIRQRSMDPASLASDEAPRRYFRDGVPYARQMGGTVATIEALRRGDLERYAREAYRPGGGGLVVVGDVDAEEIRSLATECFGSWRGAARGADAFTAEPATRERRIWIVDRPGSVQSEIRVGHVGAARSTPDYFALTVANLLLGGTFTSRLNLNLRERHGFTYGVRSRFAFRTAAGPFQVSTAVSTDVTGAAVREIVGELDRLVGDGVSAEEVEATRDYAAGVFGLQLETVGQIATRLTQLVVYGLPDGYFHGYRDRVRAVTRTEVDEAARRHIRPSEVQVVVVGDAAAIRGDLEALELGPVEVAGPTS